MNILSLTSSQLRQAAKLKEKIAALEKRLSAIFGPSSPVTRGRRKKHVMSDAGRLAIAAAQKLRWGKAKTGPKRAMKIGRRKMSAAARAKIAAAVRARWAKVKAAGKKSL